MYSHALTHALTHSLTHTHIYIYIYIYTFIYIHTYINDMFALVFKITLNEKRKRGDFNLFMDISVVVLPMLISLV